MHLYVGPMDAVVLEVSDEGRIRLEHEGWSTPTLQERRAVIYAAREAIATLTEAIEALERVPEPGAGRA